MTLAPVTDHVERGLSRLIEQYQGRPRLEAWVRSYLREVQALSDAAWDVLVSRLIDDSEGAQLDVLGKIVGEARGDLDDETYRVFIRTRIRINQSNGQPEDIIAVLLLIAPDTAYLFNEYYPAAMAVELLEEPGISPEKLLDLLLQTKAGGVHLTVVSPTADEDTRFLFGDADDPGVLTDTSMNGCGDADDPATFGLLSDAVTTGHA